MIDKYDAIIIGAGIGGLVSGIKLANKGEKVLILEQHNVPGGYVTSIKRNGFVLDMGAHILGGCGRMGIFSLLARETGLKTDFIRFDPTDRFNIQGDVIEVPQEMERYISKLKKMFPEEEEQIHRFFKDIKKIYFGFSNKKIQGRYKDFTYQEILEKYFQNDKLKGILSAQCLYICAPPERASFLGVVNMMITYLLGGTFYPKGGTINFPLSLAKTFKDLGGTIHYKERATNLQTTGKKVKIVKTDKGEYEADIVISNIDARTTFNKLIGEPNLPEAYSRKLRSLNVGLSCFLMHLCVKDFSEEELMKMSGCYYSSYDINESFDNCYYLFVPTLQDSSLAPKDHHIIEYLRHYEIENDDDFEKKTNGWDTIKAELQTQALSRIGKSISGLEKKIVSHYAAGPSAFKKYTGNSLGAMCGWDLSFDQILDKRLEQTTPFENLFLVGHWTIPGCGVATAAASAYRLIKILYGD